MKENKKNKIELLAPAGNLDCAIAAFQSGADAVYAGISRFNAREMGENFTWDDLSRLSAYTKKNNKRFYLTLNTLVKETEFEELGQMVERVSELVPDAVIVQDIGVVRFLREYFPELIIHASTQMGIHNSHGVKTAASMGIKRVILERQLTTEELFNICKEPVEIEVFIHGALCCSISGHCLFSSWLGGWSGNRGRCKQPCRRRFYSNLVNGKQSGFFFSTQDLYSLDMIETLKEAGVCSLKIEGRLKKPDYVKSVVRAYRMMLDAPIEDRFSTLKEARLVLASSYGRKWSHGFSTTEDMNSLIQYKSAGVSGRLAGSVEKISKKGFEVLVIQRLHVGDRIRIQPKTGEEGPSITITRMTKEKRPIKTASRDDRVFIHCDKEVYKKSLVYKIGDTSIEIVKRPANLPLYCPPLGVDINLQVSNYGIKVFAITTNKKEYFWENDIPIEEAQNLPLNKEALINAFSVTRNTFVRLNKINVSIDFPKEWKGIFIPAGNLKKIRRGFWEWFTQKTEISELIEACENGINLEKPKNNWLAKLKKDIDLNRCKNKNEALNAVLGNNNKNDTIRVKPIVDFIDKPEKDVSEVILPFFCPESRLKTLEDYVKKAYSLGIRRFRITSIYQISLLRQALQKKEKDLTDIVFLTASFPLPVANSLAAKELETLGVKRSQIWLELDKEAIMTARDNWPVVAEIYKRGKPFLLATRASISAQGRITDSRGKSFFIEKPFVRDLDFSVTDGLGFVFPAEVLSFPKTRNCVEYSDSSRVLGTEKVSSFNYDFTLV